MNTPPEVKKWIEDHSLPIWSISPAAAMMLGHKKAEELPIRFYGSSSRPS